MPIEFKVRVSDLRNAVDQILVNRDKHTKKRDIADLLVSEVVATIRTTGCVAEMPIIGTLFGAARVPLAILEQMAEVARTYNQPDIRVTVSNGSLRVETWKTNNTAIKETKLESIPDFTIDLPVDASTLDTLGLASLLSESQITDQGLAKRVNHAKREADGAIQSAANALAEFGVSADQIKQLVNQNIKVAATKVAKSLDSDNLQKSTAKRNTKISRDYSTDWRTRPRSF